MSFKARYTPALLIALSIFALVPHQAHAYIDPGSGSLIWQVVMAVLLSGMILVKSYWQRLKQLLGRAPVSQEEGAEELDDEQRQG
jgi:hypothetical protein